MKTIDVEGGLQLRDETPQVMDSGRPTRVSQDWMTKKAARSDQNEPRFFLTRSAWHPGVGAALVGPKDLFPPPKMQNLKQCIALPSAHAGEHSLTNKSFNGNTAILRLRTSRRSLEVAQNAFILVTILTAAF